MPDEATTQDQSHAACFGAVSASYFDVMETPLQKGRVFTDHDDAAYKLVSKLLKGDYDWFKGELVTPVVPTPEQVEEAMAKLA